jgi:hypothetical protein
MVENVCKTPGCGKPASMSCPTCLKLGLEAARFCSQECFKGYWGVHKAVHTEAKLKIKALLDQQQILARKAAEGVEGFKRFKFTGPLRPGKVRASVLAYLLTHMYLVHMRTTYIRRLFIHMECLCLRSTPGTA